jgi:hypothetical protein
MHILNNFCSGGYSFEQVLQNPYSTTGTNFLFFMGILISNFPIAQNRDECVRVLHEEGCER